MTANPNRAKSNPPKRVLMIVANAATSPTTGWPVGFWWSEVTHAYWELVEAGYEIEIRSPDGGALEADGFSDPEHESGYSASDILSLGFKHSKAHAGLLSDTKSLDDVSPNGYDAVYVAGGQSPMVTFRGNEKVQRVIASFYEAGRVVALVCHGTCVLLETKLSNGELLVSGKTWTGFANAEEKVADEAVGQRLQPFWIEDEARKIENTNFVVGPAFRSFAVRDGLLVTGQQQESGADAARLLIEAVGR